MNGSESSPIPGLLKTEKPSPLDTAPAKQPIAIFGAGGFGLEVALLIEHINMTACLWDIIGFFDDGVAPDALVNDWPVLGGLNTLNHWRRELAVVFAIGDPHTKKYLVEKISNGKVTFPTLIHPNVVRGAEKYVSIGEGSIICAGSYISTNVVIGRHVIINFGCSIGHETTIGDYSSFMPACNISGEVTIGQASYWGTGAKIIQRKHVGAETTIGAGAVVISDIPDKVTAVGVPAKIKPPVLCS